jgi:hypothetical protein
MKIEYMEEPMLRNIFVVLVITVLLAACGPARAPVASPTDPAASPTTEPVAPSQPDDSYPGPSSFAPDNSSAYPVPMEPLPGDENLERGNVFIDSTEILIMESFPLQFSLIIDGNLPTPCHQLRANLSEPDAQNRINVELFTLVDPTHICIQVLKPFSENIPLGSFPDGTYTIVLNGQEIGQIKTP